MKEIFLHSTPMMLMNMSRSNKIIYYEKGKECKTFSVIPLIYEGNFEIRNLINCTFFPFRNLQISFLYGKIKMFIARHQLYSLDTSTSRQAATKLWKISKSTAGKCSETNMDDRSEHEQCENALETNSQLHCRINHDFVRTRGVEKLFSSSPSFSNKKIKWTTWKLLRGWESS